jgi:hypothetical protein
MLAVDEVDDVVRVFGGQIGEPADVGIVGEGRRELVEHLADHLALLAEPDQLLGDLAGA